MEKTYIELLMERIKKNYEDFKDDTLGLVDGDLIYGMAEKITAMETVYMLAKTFPCWIEEAEAAYLLEFAEPLKMLADVWEDVLLDVGGEFRAIVEEVLDADDNNDHYISADYANELKQKYGADVDIREALFHEVMETGKRLTLLRNMLDDDEGVDFCQDKG